MKSYSTLLGAALILVSGGHKQVAELPRKQSQSNELFDVARAMNMFYGNYSVKDQASTLSLPSDRNNESAAMREKQMLATPLFSAFVGDSTAKSFVLISSAVPRDAWEFDCHACRPIIGMAVFSQKGLKWTMDASNRAVTDAGGWGEPPSDIKLVQIGPGHWAIKVIDRDEGGDTTAVLLVLIPWKGTVNPGLERIIANNDHGMCEPKGGLPCYANHRTVTFVRNDKDEYYNLELDLTGTDLTDSGTATPMRMRKVRGLETLKFDNGKYVQVTRRGDLTHVDRAVAQREALR